MNVGDCDETTSKIPMLSHYNRARMRSKLRSTTGISRQKAAVLGALIACITILLLLGRGLIGYSPRLLRPWHSPTQSEMHPRPHIDENSYVYPTAQDGRANAAIISLVRNSELVPLIQSMTELEATWNHKFKYPWIFLNDEPFTDEFKDATRYLTAAPVSYGAPSPLPPDISLTRLMIRGCVSRRLGGTRVDQ